MCSTVWYDIIIFLLFIYIFILSAGKCVKGIRQIPVKMLDVAGLVPGILYFSNEWSIYSFIGASEGKVLHNYNSRIFRILNETKGLGNQFLDDLRHADVLLHVIDCSGTTNEKGENTTGYASLCFTIFFYIKKIGGSVFAIIENGRESEVMSAQAY